MKKRELAMVAAVVAAVPRTSCFVEDSQKSFAPYDLACRHYAEPETNLAAADLAQSPWHPPCQVLLNVYEIAAFGQINRLTASERCPIGGALHVGVEVFGREWSYGGGQGQGSGVVCEVPRRNRQHRFRETVVLEQTKLSDGEVALVIGELLESWHPNDYHWLHRNCLAFANELCGRLGVGRIPAWIDRFARGAGAVDMGVRGIAGGFAESVHGVAEGARGVLKAIVEGPQACGQCASTARRRSEAQGQLLLPDGCRRFCSQPEDEVVLVGIALPPSRSICEVVNDPDEKIVYESSNFGIPRLPSAVVYVEESEAAFSAARTTYRGAEIIAPTMRQCSLEWGTRLQRSSGPMPCDQLAESLASAASVSGS